MNVRLFLGFWIRKYEIFLKSLIEINNAKEEIIELKEGAMKERIENGAHIDSRPENWGGFQIKVNFFEFWEANDDRLNYRECYKKSDYSWQKYFLQS